MSQFGSRGASKQQTQTRTFVKRNKTIRKHK
jgi:hypothetical protein